MATKAKDNTESAVSAPSEDLIFITYQGDWHHDPETRRIVRKRAFDSTRVAKVPAVSTGSSQTNSGSLRDQQHRFRVSKQRNVPLHKVDQLQELPRSVSPLEPTLRRLGDDSYRILGYYHHTFQQNSLAINVEGGWLAFTLSDEAVTHAQLALTSLTLDVDSSGKTSYLKHSSASMQLIRGRLSNNAGQFDDAVVGAVALLLIAESLQSDVTSSKSHSDALNSMLALRGGYNGFSHLAALQRVISWARRAYGLRWLRPSGAPQVTNCLPDEIDPLAKSIRDLQRDQMPDEIRAILPDSLQQVLAGFQTVSIYQSQPGQTKQKWISAAIFEVERMLMYLDDNSFARLFRSPREYCPLSSLFHLAGHIYLLIVLRQIHRQFPIVQAFADVLASKLKAYHRRRVATENTQGEKQLLLWIHTLQCISTVESEVRLEAQKGLLSVCQAMEIVDFAGFSNTLKQVAWVDRTLGEDLSDVWNTMMTAAKNLRNVSCFVLRKSTTTSAPTLCPAVYQRSIDPTNPTSRGG
ncbi:uncharacterized protein LTR77_001199 [Saxophila tyrrhenica]|uniref:Uncharacterized protein n=1 Tax=Saxophila tyrrhenica TaxID=1690608 RepID=A0AAV9PKS2_9PEZI|nr:hypothetical protein LTR77_001199 [Saxophila tyrrhenica]